MSDVEETIMIVDGLDEPVTASPAVRVRLATSLVILLDVLTVRKVGKKENGDAIRSRGWCYTGRYSQQVGLHGSNVEKL